ncbi:hypothetical protein [Streptomyces goshikiensis]|uniref:hypothetical protein n=1 Tax=Streptomyces goshikiensis TaxID=1942 RepID=UPI00368D5719
MLLIVVRVVVGVAVVGIAFVGGVAVGRVVHGVVEDCGVHVQRFGQRGQARSGGLVSGG